MEISEFSTLQLSLFEENNAFEEKIGHEVYECEDLSNQEEFMLNSEVDTTHESMEHTMTNSSTIIPHQCGNLSVDE